MFSTILQFITDMLMSFGLEPQMAQLATYAIVLLVIWMIWSFLRSSGLFLLLAGGLGYYLVKNNKLEDAFNVEDGLSKISDVFKKFKDKQKNRYKAATANETVIQELDKRLAELKKSPGENSVEIRVLEKEISERKDFTDKLISDDEFVVFGDDEDTAGVNVRPMPISTFEVYNPDEVSEINTNGNGPGNIDLDGYNLLDG
ncbi:MAG: hypothetical protein ACRBF0_07845 [Calditrichia bacterium]